MTIFITYDSIYEVFKKKIIFFLFFSFLIIFYLISKKNTNREYDYFSADCTVYNREGKVLFYSKDLFCDFADNGAVLSSDPSINSLKMTDKNGQVLWSSYENAHHDLKFVDNQNHFLAITSEVVKYQDREVKSDCFSKRDLKNTILMKWCLSKNVARLQSLGFDFTPTLADKSSINELIYPKYEISHANSIYQIEKNALSSTDPVFAEGNFIINIFAPSFAVVILDKDMKKILWTKNLTRQYFGFNLIKLIVHDVQVTADGKILAYSNFHTTRQFSLFDNFVELPLPNTRDPSWHSSLIKMDPYFGYVQWIYQALPKYKFRSKVLGSVTELNNHNYMYSDITETKPAVYEVSTDGLTVSKIILPTGNIPKSNYHIKKSKPMYNTSFLNSRGLLD